MCIRDSLDVRERSAQPIRQMGNNNIFRIEMAGVNQIESRRFTFQENMILDIRSHICIASVLKRQHVIVPTGATHNGYMMDWLSTRYICLLYTSLLQDMTVRIEYVDTFKITAQKPFFTDQFKTAAAAAAILLQIIHV